MPSLVTPDEVKAQVPGAAALDPAALQLVIDANEQLLRSVYPLPTNPTTVILEGYGRTTLLLPVRMATITEVVEHWLFADPVSDITLDATDYRLAPGGTAIERLVEGVNRRDYFADVVEITGAPEAIDALVKQTIIQLCAVDVNATPGAGLVTRQRLGDYEQETSTSAANSGSGAQAKNDILSQLVPPLPVFS